MIDPTKPIEDYVEVVSRYNKMVVMLSKIAQQNLYDEMDEDQQEYADLEGAYEIIIKVARATLDDCQETEYKNRSFL